MSKQTEKSAGVQIAGIIIGGFIVLFLTFAVASRFVGNSASSVSSPHSSEISETSTSETPTAGRRSPSTTRDGIGNSSYRGTDYGSPPPAMELTDSGGTRRSVNENSWGMGRSVSEDNSVQPPRFDTNTVIQQQRPTDIEARNELIQKVIHVDMALNAAGFSGYNAMSDLANFGTSRGKTAFDNAYDTWRRASEYDKDTAKAAFERVRTDIKNFAQREITPRPYFGDWTYQISNLPVSGNESSFTMNIDVGFNCEKFRSLDIKDTLLLFPSGVTATISEFRSSMINIHVHGNTNVIRDIDENKRNYRARICFTNFRSSDVPTRTYSNNPTSAEVLHIAIVRR